MRSKLLSLLAMFGAIQMFVPPVAAHELRIHLHNRKASLDKHHHVPAPNAEAPCVVLK